MKISALQSIIDILRGKTKKQKLKNVHEQFLIIKRESDKANRGFDIKWENKKLCLYDSTSTTDFDAHYVYHTAWAIRKVLETNPIKHIDISSSLYFVSNLSAFLPVDFYDFRPATLTLSNLTCKQADVTQLHFDTESLESLSCMHVVEHVGLGRYGDSIDAIGDLKAINELKRVIQPSGILIFVVPVGNPKIEFNAHRIYSYEQIMSYFSDFELKEFSLIPDNAVEVGMIHHADKNLVQTQNYGCGCFVFQKGKNK